MDELADRMGELLQIRLLGPFEIRRPDGTQVGGTGRQSMAVLACLAMSEDGLLARQPLAELVWHGRGAEHANGSLRQELVRLRRAIGEQALPAGGTTAQPVRLEAQHLDIDVIRLRKAAAMPGGGGEVVALARGVLLQDFPLRPKEPFSDWLIVQRRRIQDVVDAMMLRMLLSGEGSVPLAQKLLDSNRTCEDAYRFLMRHHAALGDTSTVQDIYNTCEQALQAVGLEVSFETRTLLNTIRAEINEAAQTVFQLRHLPAAHPEPHEQPPDLAPAPATGQLPLRRLPEITSRPSVVVLPFTDLSEERSSRSQAIADLITEETTSALARSPGFFVTSRYSAMAYRNAAIDVRLIAAELGVRYLLEGTIECGRQHMRCHVRLIDGQTGQHLWASRHEAAADDDLALRDAIVHATVGRLLPRLLGAETVLARKARPGARDAWTELMLASGEMLRLQSSSVAHQRALEHAHRALEIDPTHPMAHAFAGFLLNASALAGMSGNPIRDRFRARRHMARALAGDNENPIVLAMSSEIAMYSAGDIDHALALAEDAVRFGPSDAQALSHLGHVRRIAGEDPTVALALIAQAQRLSPRDPRNTIWLHHAAWCHWKLHDFAQMESLARQSVDTHPMMGWSWLQLAGALALQGRAAEARAAYDVMQGLMPSMSPRRFYWTARFFYRRRFSGHVKQDYSEFCDALESIRR